MKAREILAAYYDEQYDHGAKDFADGIISLLSNNGFVILPKEPSEGMLKAMADFTHESTAPQADWMHDDLREAYRAMIKVAEE